MSQYLLSTFYIINSEDLDAALDWAGQVSGCIGRPIEVQPFAGTGRVTDRVPMSSPVMALNRAIAISETKGPEVGLAELDPVRAELGNYYPLHAARAAALRRLGRTDEARHAFERVAGLATSNADRNYFAAQLHQFPESGNN